MRVFLLPLLLSVPFRRQSPEANRKNRDSNRERERKWTITSATVVVATTTATTAISILTTTSSSISNRRQKRIVCIDLTFCICLFLSSRENSIPFLSECKKVAIDRHAVITSRHTIGLMQWHGNRNDVACWKLFWINVCLFSGMLSLLFSICERIRTTDFWLIKISMVKNKRPGASRSTTCAGVWSWWTIPMQEMLAKSGGIVQRHGFHRHASMTICKSNRSSCLKMRACRRHAMHRRPIILLCWCSCRASVWMRKEMELMAEFLCQARRRVTLKEIELSRPKVIVIRKTIGYHHRLTDVFYLQRFYGRRWMFTGNSHFIVQAIFTTFFFFFFFFLCLVDV